jgi:hypothetical protein
LDLEDFTYEYYSFGINVYISPLVDETKLFFKNKSKYAKIILLDAQKYKIY